MGGYTHAAVDVTDDIVAVLISDALIPAVHADSPLEVESVSARSPVYSGNTRYPCKVAELISLRAVNHEHPAAVLLLQSSGKRDAEIGRMVDTRDRIQIVLNQQLIGLICASDARHVRAAASDYGIHPGEVDTVVVKELPDHLKPVVKLLPDAPETCQQRRVLKDVRLHPLLLVFKICQFGRSRPRIDNKYPVTHVCCLNYSPRDISIYPVCARHASATQHFLSAAPL